MNDLIPHENIEQRIFWVRKQKVMIGRDLAELYGVETKHLNRQVKRNLQRFPEEFMFQLTIDERNQLVTICHRFETMKHASTLPYAFTEHGVAMLARYAYEKKESLFRVKRRLWMKNPASTVCLTALHLFWNRYSQMCSVRLTARRRLSLVG